MASPPLKAATLVTLLTLSMLLSGCHTLVDGDGGGHAGDDAHDHDGHQHDEADEETGDGDGSEAHADDGNVTDPNATEPGSGADETPAPSFSFANFGFSPDPKEDESIRLAVDVEADPSDPFKIDHIEVHWANHSVTDTTGIDPYGNVSGLQEQWEAPNEFNASFVVPFNGTLYYRYHILHDGSSQWSTEQTVNIAPAGGSTGGGTPSGTQHTVEIGTLITGPAANFAPDPLTVNVGDSVIWINRDSTPHTSRRTSDPSWDTGTLSQNQESTPVVFTAPGTFNYVCGLHPTTMSGTITVQASGS